MLARAGNHFVRHHCGRSDAHEILGDTLRLAALDDEKPNRLRQQCNQQNGDDDRNRSADAKYRLPSIIADERGNRPTREGTTYRQGTRDPQPGRVALLPCRMVGFVSAEALPYPSPAEAARQTVTKFRELFGS